MSRIILAGLMIRSRSPEGEICAMLLPSGTQKLPSSARSIEWWMPSPSFHLILPQRSILTRLSPASKLKTIEPSGRATMPCRKTFQSVSGTPSRRIMRLGQISV